MRYNVVIRQVGRGEYVPFPVGVVIQVESESPQGAAAEADAWVRENKDERFSLGDLIPCGTELVMELHDPAERGKPG